MGEMVEMNEYRQHNIWERYCLVCDKEYTHVYPASCTKIQCECFLWFDTPAPEGE